jgi:hypothetical protein
MREMEIERLKPHRDEMPLDLARRVVEAAIDHGAYEGGVPVGDAGAQDVARTIVGFARMSAARGLASPASRDVLAVFAQGREQARTLERRVSDLEEAVGRLADLLNPREGGA